MFSIIILFIRLLDGALQACRSADVGCIMENTNVIQGSQMIDDTSAVIGQTVLLTAPSSQAWHMVSSCMQTLRDLIHWTEAVCFSVTLSGLHLTG